MNAASEAPPSVFKKCRCGQAYTREQWGELEYCGVQHVPADEFGPEINLELRHCLCGSTIAVDCK